MKVLIIRFSSIGDIVLTTPAIRCLKQQIPGAEVHFLTKTKFRAVTVANPYIDQFHYFDNNLRQLIRDIRKERYDYIIDLHKNWRTLRIYLETDTKTKWLSYRKLSIQKFLLTKLGINVMPGIHISRRSLDALRPLGIKDDGKGLDYFIPGGEEIEITELPLSHQMGYIAIVIGGSYYTKKLPVYKLQELCLQIQHPIVLLGGKEDREAGTAIAAVDPVKIYNACGKFSLNESADITRKARLVISHDTGLQYIACAFQKPVLAIWGGTSPKLDVEPYYGSAAAQKHTNFIVPALPCQPCSNFGTTTCPKKHFKCMHLQDVPAIAEKVRRLIEDSAVT
ncbi:MAG: glycosyltransferase family 9 protein [Chitinophagaceae bacterium]|nr:glycosyltransferase family 9 protein [Chitinophagaceae bacterium]